MNKSQALERAACAGFDIEPTVSTWMDAAELLALVDTIGRAGGSALIKVDGARADNRVYTVVVSGGRLADEFFRKDGPELQPLLLDAVAFYLAKCSSGTEDG